MTLQILTKEVSIMVTSKINKGGGKYDRKMDACNRL